MDYDDEITKLKQRIEHLEGFLNNFDSYKSYNKSGNGQCLTVIKPKNIGKGKRGSRLQEDWKPSSAVITWATKEYSNVDLKLEYEKFVDYWLSRADKGAIKLDWDRTFRNWIRQASSQYRGKRETHQRSDSSYTNAVRGAFD